MKLKVLLRKKGGAARARAAGAETREFSERMLASSCPQDFFIVRQHFIVRLWPGEGW